MGDEEFKEFLENDGKEETENEGCGLNIPILLIQILKNKTLFLNKTMSQAIELHKNLENKKKTEEYIIKLMECNLDTLHQIDYTYMCLEEVISPDDEPKKE